MSLGCGGGTSCSCGCCEAAARPTPRPVYNRPSLSAVAYRIGTYADFRQSMLAAIARRPELAGLDTRASDDYGINVLELWAAVADVLTFYQERYANEAFLGTATFRDSVARLTALLGYEPRPGVAARTWLAFTLDAGKRLTVPAGQKVQSVPEEGQTPQTYETLAAVDADARFNRLRVFPPPQAINPLAAGRPGAVLDRLDGPALAAGLAPGDTLVLWNGGSTDAVEEKKIAALERLDDRVELTWAEPIQRATWGGATLAFERKRTFRLFGHDAPPQYMTPTEFPPGRFTWSLTTISDYSRPTSNTLQLDGKYEGLAPGKKLLVADTGFAGRKTLVTVTTVTQADASFGSLTAAVTQLTVSVDAGQGFFTVPAIDDRREAVVVELEGPAIRFWPGRYPEQLSGEEVWLPGVVVETESGPAVEVGRIAGREGFEEGVVIAPAELVKGRALLVESEGLIASEGATPVLASVKPAPRIEPPGAAAGSFAHLVVPLTVEGELAPHATASAALAGNVAEASHGETVAGELLGSGSATAAFQRFTLKKGPLTRLPAATPEGAAPSLEVWVNGTRFNRVTQLYGQDAKAPVYELRQADDGTAIVQFGDGETGARLPTGRGNVSATYRVGSGLAGRVGARSLTTLLAKPVGLQAAVNPLAAEGGADPETAESARESAPASVRTFGRAVSLEDFESLVRASGEVAKANATWVWDGLERAIHLTVAGQAGALFSDDALRDLATNLGAVRDPNHRLRIDNHLPVAVELSAGVAIEPEYDPDAVLEAARQAALAALSFDELSLGRSLHLSDFFRVLQEVPGVRFVDVEKLLFKRPGGLTDWQFLLYLARRGVTFLPGLVPAPVQGHLRIFAARPMPGQPGVVRAAELAVLESPDDLGLTVREG